MTAFCNTHKKNVSNEVYNIYCQKITCYGEYFNTCPWPVAYTVGQDDFLITCRDGQSKTLEKYQYLFTRTSLLSSEQVKFCVTRPDR